ncbi:MAG: HEPN domain-containing protein [Methanophagales archaeon]|nr:HEPN domain-containing protein [Methanophagales archaeon]
MLFLEKRVGIPEEFHTALKKLSPDFVITRYPDAVYGLPYEAWK